MDKKPTIQPHTILYHGRLYSCSLVDPKAPTTEFPHFKADDGNTYYHLIELDPTKVPIFCRNINWDPDIPLPIVHAIGD